MSDSISRRLARFAAALDFDSLPANVVDKLKASLVHGLVMSFAGRKTAAAKATIELAIREEAKSDGATILTDGRKATRYGAAFANSSLLHATNQGDTYRMLAHPGPCVIPAVLATAEIEAATGRALLTGLAAGYEVECRLAGDFLPSTQARGFRSSPIYGTFGAAVGAAKTRGLNEDGMHSAIGWASTFTAGLVEGSHAFHEPNSTRNGVLASVVADEHFPGSERSLDGPGGFYNAFTGNHEGRLTYAFHGARKASLENIADDLGERWELLHIIPKIHPTPGFNLPIIALIRGMQQKHSFQASNVRSVQVLLNWLETSYPSPQFVDAQPGKPPRAGGTSYVVAYTCIHGDYPAVNATPNQTSSEDQRVRDLMSRVEVLGVWDRLPFAPRITLHMQNGESLVGEYNGSELEWDFDTELASLRPLFNDLEWPVERLEGIVEAVSGVEQLPDLTRLIKLCVP